jgi:hypothetical protein
MARALLWDLCFDDVKEANELLVLVAFHVALTFVVVGHRVGAAGLHRQVRLGAVERLDLALLVDAEHDGVRGRIDIEPDDVAQLGYELGGRLVCAP